MVTFALCWSALVWQRLTEVRRSRRHTRRLLQEGAREWYPGHYPVMVAIHTLWFTLWLAEVLCCGAGWQPLWLLPAAAGQGLRAWAQHTLGQRWTTRILVFPGEKPVRRGPFRWLAHPNYLGVVLELLAFPLAFAAWRSALALSLANAGLLAWRIRREEQAWIQSGN